MSQRLLAIALCFSVMGMTVIPARFMPCCCKAAHQNLGKGAMGVSMSPFVLQTEEARQRQRSHPACCGTAMHATQSACCHSNASTNRSMGAGRVLTVPCPKCTCITELQIVALPGIALSEKTYKLSEVAAVEQTPIVGPAERLAAPLSELSPPGIVLTLQTCSFRC